MKNTLRRLNKISTQGTWVQEPLDTKITHCSQCKREIENGESAFTFTEGTETLTFCERCANLYVADTADFYHQM